MIALKVKVIAVKEEVIVNEPLQIKMVLAKGVHFSFDVLPS